MEQMQVRTGWVIPAALSWLSFAVSAVAAAPSSTTASTAVTREGNQLCAQLLEVKRRCVA